MFAPYPSQEMAVLRQFVSINNIAGLSKSGQNRVTSLDLYFANARECPLWVISGQTIAG
jgi:hypothetical protein